MLTPDILFLFHLRSFSSFVSLSLVHSLRSNLSTLYPQLVSLYVLTGTALLNALAIWSSTPLIYIIRLFLTRGRLSPGNYAPLERSNGQSNMTIRRKEIKKLFLPQREFSSRRTLFHANYLSNLLRKVRNFWLIISSRTYICGNS